MLLGTLEDQRLREDGLVVYFRPFSDNEKLYVMGRMMGTLTEGELVFPFPVLQPGTLKELSCPPDGWEIDEPLAEQLGEGEVCRLSSSVLWFLFVCFVCFCFCFCFVSCTLFVYLFVF